jgi:hypothetical protein
MCSGIHGSSFFDPTHRLLWQCVRNVYTSVIIPEQPRIKNNDNILLDTKQRVRILSVSFTKQRWTWIVGLWLCAYCWSSSRAMCVKNQSPCNAVEVRAWFDMAEKVHVGSYAGSLILSTDVRSIAFIPLSQRRRRTSVIATLDALRSLDAWRP